jgi:hypothetical protein
MKKMTKTEQIARNRGEIRDYLLYEWAKQLEMDNDRLRREKALLERKIKRMKSELETIQGFPYDSKKTIEDVGSVANRSFDKMTEAEMIEWCRDITRWSEMMREHIG